MTKTPDGVPQLFDLLLLTSGAVLVHGYHPYVENAEIYVPGIKQTSTPASTRKMQSFLPLTPI
jgi:hypothetical protein